MLLMKDWTKQNAYLPICISGGLEQRICFVLLGLSSLV